MAETIDLVYVGSKPEKHDTAFNTLLVFPQGVPIPVPVEVAVRMLLHPDVWVKASEYSSVKELQQQKELAEIRAKAEAEKAAQAEAERLNLMVEPWGDLGKLTSVKLKTIVESEELGIKLEQGEKVIDFAYRVRDALKAKGAGSVKGAVSAKAGS